MCAIVGVAALVPVDLFILYAHQEHRNSRRLSLFGYVFLLSGVSNLVKCRYLTRQHRNAKVYEQDSPVYGGHWAHLKGVMMKRCMLLGILIALFVGVSATTQAASYLNLDQAVGYSYNSASYWGMVYDYTDGYIEVTTGGYLTYDTWLWYKLYFWDVQVAYIYDASYGRYTEALALRNVVF